MKTSIKRSDFIFRPSGYGQYFVTYINPVTNKCFTKYMTDMQLIDATKNAENPKKSDLNKLKRLCKSN